MSPGLLQKQQGGRVRGSLMKRRKVGGPGRVQGWAGLAGHTEVVEFGCERVTGPRAGFLGFFEFLNFIFLYSRFLLVIYFIHISVYMSIPIHPTSPPPLSPLGVHKFVPYICVSISDEGLVLSKGGQGWVTKLCGSERSLVSEWRWGWGIWRGGGTFRMGKVVRSGRSLVGESTSHGD